MGSDNFLKEQEKVACIELPDKVNYITKFKLYETHSNFYMIGWNKSKTVWRILKIDRSETSELIIVEDSVRYSEIECQDLLRRISAGNMSTGGLKFVTICYGIIGFIKFLGPHYMLLITDRTKIGMICGHAVYSVSKSRMIPIPNSTKNYNNSYSKNENRYKKLLQTVDLTKDFFFSYSYHVMHSLQKNLSTKKSGLGFYETMFVWNEYLTRGIRNQLKNSLWTVALVHGFFKQAQLTVSGREFFLTLIARRSRHYAGTRFGSTALRFYDMYYSAMMDHVHMQYLKRGVNEKGRVANEVETEQIVFEDFHEGRPVHISSVVQIRGSIPLFWSQETSRYYLKPDIILSRKDHNYEATKLHFQNLVKRYGNPIIILNLIKAREKKPRESILHAEFVNAIEVINKDLSEENHLKFLHWDLNRYSRVATSALQSLVNVASSALRLTGIFCCQVLPTSRTEKSLNSEGFINSSTEKDVDIQRPLDEFPNDSNNFTYTNGDCHIKLPTFQKGVLRTNCIDCLDRTNVAQYAYGLVALGHQLYALGFINAAFISLDFPLAENIMKIYEEMGDTLALQYGGSPAHNKIFSEKRGQWKAATHSQEFIRLFQRYCSNAYMDGEKQDAINIFLGHFQPQPGKPALWELDSDQHYKVGSLDSKSANEKSRSAIKRSFSDGSILCETSSDFEDESRRNKQDSSHALLDKVESGLLELSDSTRELSTCDGEISYSRYTPSMPGKIVFQTTKPDSESDGLSPSAQGETFDYSNFVNVDWISSSSCEEDFYERYALLRSSYCDLTCFGNANELKAGTSSVRSGSPLSIMGKGSAADVHLGSEENAKLSGFSETFVKWVTHGDMLFT